MRGVSKRKFQIVYMSVKEFLRSKEKLISYKRRLLEVSEYLL